MTNNRPHWADTAIAIFTGLMLITYITGNWFARQQLKLTRKAIEQAKVDNTTAIAAQQAIAQAALTSSQQSFDKSFAATVEQFHLDQRAWMNITFGTFIKVPNVPLQIPMTLLNVGKTPAKRFSGYAIVEKISRGQIPHFSDRSTANHFGGGALIPNAKIEGFSFQSRTLNPQTNKPEPQKASELDVKEINEGDAYVSVHGQIRYFDIFGKSHWVKFCQYTSGEIAKVQSFVKPCSDYNDAD